jgi:hypothetical protein
MSASDRNERQELKAFHELESLVRSLGEELAAFRRRALAAEAQLKEGGQPAARAKFGSGASGQSETDVLRTRLAHAEERVKQMMDRVRFLRQQVQAQTGAGAGR